jgi:L-alanine-DL-glutamate epimerase-like enolase superfamily enzyme
MDILIAGGEQDYMLPQWRGYCNPPAVHVVQPDICYVGGFSRALLIANMSHASGQRSTPHCANRSMLAVFSSHYLCVAENSFPFMEYSIEPEPWTAGVVADLPQLQNGKFTPTEKPGWGVSISPDWLKKSVYQVTA